MKQAKALKKKLSLWTFIVSAGLFLPGLVMLIVYWSLGTKIVGIIGYTFVVLSIVAFGLLILALASKIVTFEITSKGVTYNFTYFNSEFAKCIYLDDEEVAKLGQFYQKEELQYETKNGSKLIITNKFKNLDVKFDDMKLDLTKVRTFNL